MNLIEALNSAGVQWHPHKSREGELYLCCPFCVERHESPDYRFRLSVNYISGMGHCHNCGWSSRNSLAALSHMLSLGRLEVATVPYVTQKRPNPTKLPEEFVELEGVDEDCGPLWTIKKYLLDRGVTEKQIVEKKIGGAIEGQYRWSAIFPVYNKSEISETNEEGLCGWVSRDVTGKRKGVDRRTLEEKPLPYLNSSGTKYAYNVPNPVPEGSTIVVLEGIFKALAVERCFGPKMDWFAIATQGSSLTDIQVCQLAGVKEVVLFCDPGPPQAVNGYLSVAQNIRHLFERISFAYPLPKKQADELTRNEIIEYLRGRRRYSPLVTAQMKQEAIRRY